MRRIICSVCAALFVLVGIPAAAAGSVSVVKAASSGPLKSLNKYDYDWSFYAEYDADSLVASGEGLISKDERGYAVNSGKQANIYPYLFPTLDTPVAFHIVVEADKTFLSYVSATYNSGEVFQSNYYGSFDIYSEVSGFRFQLTKGGGGIKSVKIYSGVKVSTNPGGLSGTPLDLRYAVDFVSGIWDGIWSVVSSSWWLMAFVVLGLAGGVTTIIINLVFSFQPKYRDGVGVWGVSSLLRRRVFERREEKENEMKKQRKKELHAADADFVTVDGVQYHRNYRNLSRYFASRRELKKIPKHHSSSSSNSRKIDYIHTDPPPMPQRSYDVDISVDD